MLEKYLAFLFRPVNAASLGFLRIALGIITLYQFKDLYGYICLRLPTSSFYVTYDGFSWLPMLSSDTLTLLYGLAYLSSIFFTIGFHYRINAVIIFLIFTYSFLVDKGHYNNHFYLYSILLFFFTIVDAHKWKSLDAYFGKTTGKFIPYWQIFIFKLQIFIVYFFGGIAKLHLDWLQGFPLRFWLYDNAHKFSGWYGDFLRTEFAPIFYSYSGILLDFAAGFMLFHKKTRQLIILPLLFFHISNHFLWNIGSFPFSMIILTTLFFNSDWPEIIIHFFKNQPIQQTKAFFSSSWFKKSVAFMFPFGKNITNKNQINASSNNAVYKIAHWRKQIIGLFLFIWFTFQFLFPLRHFAYKGHPSWTGEGHLFAWRMMLVDTVDALKIKVIIPETGEEFPIDILYYINYRQLRKMSRTPKGFLRFAHFIRDEVKEKGGISNPIVKMELYKSINERTPRLLNDTTLNYAEVEYHAIKPTKWFTEWEETDEIPKFTMDKYEHWKRFKPVN